MTWKSKRPVWSVSEGDWSFSITWRDSYSMGGLAMEMAKGDITDSDTIQPKYLRDHDFEQVLEHIESFLASTKNFTTDGFNPKITTDEAKKLLKQIAVFSNAEPVIDIRAKTSTFVASIERTHGRIPVKSLARVAVNENEVTLRVEARVNDQVVLYGSGHDLKSLWTSMIKVMQQVTSNELDEKYAPAFLGYLFVCTGFSIFEEYEAAFYDANSSELYRQIERAFRKVGW